jgi:hypothetical protein
VTSMLAAVTATMLLVSALFPQSVSATPSPGNGPTFVYPSNGATLPYSSSLVFEVRPVTGATGYLWGFFQQGKAVWENYHNEGVLSGTRYQIDPGTAGHNAIKPGTLQVWVRALINGDWTDATILDVNDAGDSPASSRPCPNITFYGLRGSGEPAYDGEHYMGTLVFDTYGQFVSRANSVGVRVIPDGIGDAYPATPFIDLFKEDLIKNTARHELLKQEFESVQKGVVSLKNRIHKVRQADPAMCFIFSGYSQGAWVIGEYLASEDGKELAQSGKISGIVLYADPLFDPSSKGTVGEAYPGVARRLNYYSGGTTRYIPEGLEDGRFRSYCISNDVVCNFRWNSLIEAANDILGVIPGAPRDLSAALVAIPNLFCLSGDPTRVFCPHYDYRYSVYHLPMSDDGARFLGQTVLGLP